ncbi:MAG TPA: hypothetical protein PKH02_01470 [Bacteroidales bacterium]|nr:hypothetical protein [Bacteroidales bacterium]
MKHIVCILLILSGIVMNASGQSSFSDVKDSLTLTNLEMPASPAFILLDQGPSTIERPSTGKAFVYSIVNTFQANKGIPQNYAVEATPFWFFRHKDMNALKYAGIRVDNHKQLVFGNITRASFSMALINTTDTVTQQSLNSISAGFRVNILTIRRKADVLSIVNAEDSLLSFLKNREKRLDDFIHDPTLPATDRDLYNKKVDEFNKLDEKYLKGKENNVTGILAAIPLFTVDAAAGYSHFFVENNFSDDHPGRIGAWLSMNLSLPFIDKKGFQNSVNISAIGRYLSDGMIHSGSTGYTREDFFDMGGKAGFEFKKLSLAYEYVYRIGDTDSYRSNGLIKYRISDDVYITGAFGKNFGKSNNLISLLGISWGIKTGNENVKVKEK